MVRPAERNQRRRRSVLIFCRPFLAIPFPLVHIKVSRLKNRKKDMLTRFNHSRPNLPHPKLLPKKSPKPPSRNPRPTRATQTPKPSPSLPPSTPNNHKDNGRPERPPQPLNPSKKRSEDLCVCPEIFVRLSCGANNLKSSRVALFGDPGEEGPRKWHGVKQSLGYLILCTSFLPHGLDISPTINQNTLPISERRKKQNAIFPN